MGAWSVLFSLAGSSSVLACADHALGLEISAVTENYNDPFQFSLTLAFRNAGSTSLLVLPNQVRREYESISGSEFEYVPFPGPALPPWLGGFVLEPGERVLIEQAGMRDGDGTWALSPGKYQIRLRYEVSSDFESYAGKRPDGLIEGPLWIGRIQSAPINVEYNPSKN